MTKVRELGLLRWLDVATALFLVVGGLTIGVAGIIGYEAMMTFINGLGVVGRVVSVIIGLSAIYEASMWKAIPDRWCSIMSGTPHGATTG